MKQLTIQLASIAPLEFYPGEQPRLPALEMLLSRGRARSFSSRGECSIFEAIGMENISYAKQRLAGEDEQPENIDSGYWYCADPVHLQADRDQVILSHPESMDIQVDEADALIAGFNELFNEDGLTLWCSTNVAHWYLHSEQPWELSTTPLGFAENRSIMEFMPQGEDAQRWRKVITELEMLFYANPVNQQRTMSGKPTISSLWLWGVQQEQRATRPKWDLLVGEHPLVRGAHKLQGIKRLDSSASIKELLTQSNNSLIIVDELLRYQRSGDYDKILELLADLEHRIFAPAFEALKKRQLKSITIQPANGSIYRIKRHQLIRFWRKIKPVWFSFDS